VFGSYDLALEVENSIFLAFGSKLGSPHLLPAPAIQIRLLHINTEEQIERETRHTKHSCTLFVRKTLAF
jgi:hypothetical protein